MRRTTIILAFAALLAAGLWHLPATAQHAAAAQPAGQPAATPANTPANATGQPAAEITFDEYRDFRMNYIAERRARLSQQLAEPALSADEKSRLGRIKSYYDRLAALPAAERDKMFRARFDQIDTNHDGTLDTAERAAWREKQRQYYAGLASERAGAKGGDQQ